MLRRRVLLVRDIWRAAAAGSLLLRRLLLRDSPPPCALASRSAVSRRVIRDFRPCCHAAKKCSLHAVGQAWGNHVQQLAGRYVWKQINLGGIRALKGFSGWWVHITSLSAVHADALMRMV